MGVHEQLSYQRRGTILRSAINYLYCVGGYVGGSKYVSSSYYAPISSSGIGAWQSTTSYPILSTGYSGIAGQSCVISQGYIYCIDGEDNQSNPVADVFIAPISSSGIGSWQSTTAYPISVVSLSCAVWSGRVYCVGGLKTDLRDTSAVFYAKLSSSGVTGS